MDGALSEDRRADPTYVIDRFLTELESLAATDARRERLVSSAAVLAAGSNSELQEALVGRLVTAPRDEAAIGAAHRFGEAYPESYAQLLEQLGSRAGTDALGAHWYMEAADVWLTSLGNTAKAERALRSAIRRDPTYTEPATRLQKLYRENDDARLWVELMQERRSLLEERATEAEVVPLLVSVCEELGQLWTEQAQHAAAIECFQRALELDPNSHFAVFSLREALRKVGRVRDALPYYAREQALVDEPERKRLLYENEAQDRRAVGDFIGARNALLHGLKHNPRAPNTRLQLATLIFERVDDNTFGAEDRQLACNVFVGLAVEYPGEHALAYAQCALELFPGSDAAIELAMNNARSLDREKEILPFAEAYLKANPSGNQALRAQTLVKGNSSATRSASQFAPEPQLVKDLHAEVKAAASRQLASLAPRDDGPTSQATSSVQAPRTNASHEIKFLWACAGDDAEVRLLCAKGATTEMSKFSVRIYRHTANSGSFESWRRSVEEADFVVADFALGDGPLDPDVVTIAALARCLARKPTYILATRATDLPFDWARHSQLFFLEGRGWHHRFRLWFNNVILGGEEAAMSAPLSPRQTGGRAEVFLAMPFQGVVGPCPEGAFDFSSFREQFLNGLGGIERSRRPVDTMVGQDSRGGDIWDQVVFRIATARAVVVDFSPDRASHPHPNPNVLTEATIARAVYGHEESLILCAQEGTDIPAVWRTFDTTLYNPKTLLTQSGESLSSVLRRRIERVLN